MATEKNTGLTREQLEAIKAELRAEMSPSFDVEAMRTKIREEVKAEMAADAAKTEHNAERARREAMEKAKEDTVEVELFQDDGKYKDDVFVAVNGSRYQIKRGIRVKIPRMVADVLEQSAKQDKDTAKLISGYESDYQNAVKSQMM